jgi:hypothetical protein
MSPNLWGGLPLPVSRKSEEVHVGTGDVLGEKIGGLVAT